MVGYLGRNSVVQRVERMVGSKGVCSAGSWDDRSVGEWVGWLDER
jgi:hypothetical protein